MYVGGEDCSIVGFEVGIIEGMIVGSIDGIQDDRVLG